MIKGRKTARTNLAGRIKSIIGTPKPPKLPPKPDLEMATTKTDKNAIDLFEKPEVKIINYGITNDTAWEVGLACGGDIRIRLEILNNNES